MLEETGLAYNVHPIDIGAGDQFAPEFLRISPNNKIPAIVDPDGPEGKPISVFDSGAILVYLAEKTSRLMPDAPRGRFATLQWLMFQLGDLGPMLGQAHHFLGYAPEKIPYAMDRYQNEANRLYGVMDRQLGANRYFAGEEYTIADIAIFPWLRSHKKQNVDITQYPQVDRWYQEIGARAAVQRGMAVLTEKRQSGPLSQEAWDAMFGEAQYRRR
jgi:GST-like protein